MSIVEKMTEIQKRALSEYVSDWLRNRFFSKQPFCNVSGTINGNYYVDGIESCGTLIITYNSLRMKIVEPRCCPLYDDLIHIYNGDASIDIPASDIMLWMAEVQDDDESD